MCSRGSLGAVFCLLDAMLHKRVQEALKRAKWRVKIPKMLDVPVRCVVFVDAQTQCVLHWCLKVVEQPGDYNLHK